MTPAEFIIMVGCYTTWNRKNEPNMVAAACNEAFQVNGFLYECNKAINNYNALVACGVYTREEADRAQRGLFALKDYVMEHETEIDEQYTQELLYVMQKCSAEHERGW